MAGGQQTEVRSSAAANRRRVLCVARNQAACAALEHCVRHGGCALAYGSEVRDSIFDSDPGLAHKGHRP